MSTIYEQHRIRIYAGVATMNGTEAVKAAIQHISDSFELGRSSDMGLEKIVSTVITPAIKYHKEKLERALSF